MSSISIEEMMLARYGRAMRHAQYLEKQIQITVGIVLNPHFPLQSPAERRAHMESFDKKTLGALFKELEKRIAVPKSIKTKSKELLNLRNDLAHSFFFKFHDYLKDDEGRKKLIVYLDSLTANFIALDDYYCRVAEIWSGFHGPPIRFKPKGKAG